MSFLKSDKFRTFASVMFSTVILFTALFVLPSPGSKFTNTPANASGEKGTAADTTAPTLTLAGEDLIILNAGQPFSEPGFSAADNVDGDITSDVIEPTLPDTYASGTHELVYTVSDSAGNTASAKRFLLIKNMPSQTPAAEKTVYLTFDDGPCIYTEQILDILKQYNVKATFFVTGQKPEYAYVMKRIVAEGHTIAAHTYSHVYDIYTSSDTYFTDLRKINDLIYEQTGTYTAIVRFPGGSSNIISKQYKEGIMSEIVPMLSEKGYVYFDWNVDSGDATTSKPHKIVQNVKKNLKDGGSVVLMHDMKEAQLTALPQIIEHCYMNGYTFAPLTDGTPAVHHSVNN